MSDAQDISNDVKKFDFKLPENVDLRISLAGTLGGLVGLLVAIGIGMYVAETEGENVGIGAGIGAGIVAYFVIIIIAAIFFPKVSDEKISKAVGSKNEIENDKVLESCESLSDLWDVLRNTEMSFLVKEKNGNAETERWLLSGLADEYVKGLNEKIKSTQAYKKFIDALENQDKELDTFEIYNIFLVSNAVVLSGIIYDLTDRVIQQINSREKIGTWELRSLNNAPVSISESFNIDEYPKVKELASVLQQNNERYINYIIEHNVDDLVIVYNEYSDSKSEFIDLLNTKIINAIKTQPDKLAAKDIMRWVTSSTINKSVIADIFNDDKYANYPHKEILVHYINSDDKEAMYDILKDSQNKTVYDKVSNLFYTNVLIGLALTQSICSQDEDYKEYFDNLMTEGWSALYLLQLLDDNKKFTQDMGNAKKRDLKARIEDLKHKNALLSEAEKASLASEEQAQSAKNAENYAQQQANYQQQQAEYQRIQAEQAAAQTQYQKQAANNSASALKASQNAQRDAKKAKDNTDWMRK